MVDIFPHIQKGKCVHTKVATYIFYCMEILNTGHYMEVGNTFHAHIPKHIAWYKVHIPLGKVLDKMNENMYLYISAHTKQDKDYHHDISCHNYDHNSKRDYKFEHKFHVYFVENILHTF